MISHVALIVTMLVPSLQGFGPVITKFFSNTRKVWLTIDDGPDPETTPEILRLLKEYKARATFFLIGSNAGKYPELTREIVKSGHSIGNHTNNHPKFTFWRLVPSELAEEIDSFEETIRTLDLPVPIFFRAPAGLKNPFLHPILAARGLHLVGWSSRAYDTQLDDPDEIVNRLKRSLTPGSIILMHEAHRPDVCLKALERLLRELSEENYNFVVPELDQLRAGTRIVKTP